MKVHYAYFSIVLVMKDDKLRIIPKKITVPKIRNPSRMILWMHYNKYLMISLT